MSSLYDCQWESIPTLPKAVDDFVIENDFKVTLGNEVFLIMDLTYLNEKGEKERITVWSSPTGLKILSLSKRYQGDGTFKVAPHPYYQFT